MDDVSARWNLPLLQAGQAQKEMTHNEALTLLDLCVQASVQAIGEDMPPDAPISGACWIVGAEPAGAWSGHPRALAGWTEAGWRFVAPREGMTVWDAASGTQAAFRDGEWRVGELRAAALLVGGEQVVGERQPAVAEPEGGTTIDSEARAAIARLIDTMATHGLIAR